MSAEAVTNFINKTSRYGALLVQFKQDPDAFLRTYDLTPDEVEGLKSGDAGKLVAVGVAESLANRWARSLSNT